MNSYDFDQTVFWPDSSYCFVMYCLRCFPLAVLRAVPGAGWAGIKLLCHRADTKALKEKTFAFLKYLKDIDRIVADFWEEHRGNMAPWYLEQKRADDLIISASPEFLLRPMAEELGVRLIGTRMDRHTGKISGANCHDREKVRRFREAYPEAQIDAFYSDSLSDSPMAELAKTAWLVKKDQISPWPGQK